MNKIESWLINKILNNKLKHMKPGFQLKLMGFLSALSAAVGAAQLLFDGNPSTNPDWTATISAITAGIGLLIARQNNVSSEDAGIR